MDANECTSVGERTVAGYVSGSDSGDGVSATSRRALLIGATSSAAALLFGTAGMAAVKTPELRVMISGGFTAPYLALATSFEKASGVRLVTATGPSMGDAPTAIPNRLARGEPTDVIIVARSALDQLVRNGRVIPGSQVDLVRSRIGLAVKAGVPRPNISTPDDLKQTLLNARSIAYSDSASGVYVANELFKRLGIADQVSPKARMIRATPVGIVVANGEADVGFQQLSELLPIAGIQVVGAIPEALQKVTVFSAGITTNCEVPAKAHELIEYFASPRSWDAIRRAGLEPANGRVNQEIL